VSHEAKEEHDERDEQIGGDAESSGDVDRGDVDDIITATDDDDDADDSPDVWSSLSSLAVSTG
jgi:hypothetical protein